MALRACFPRNFKRFMEYDPEIHEFKGLLRKMANSILDDAVKVFNFTFQVQAEDLGVGEYNEKLKRYDGCLGALQMNQTDMIFQMNPYPMDIENVSQGLIVYETSLLFISAYNKTEISDSAQVLKSFDAFSPNLWFLCFITCLLMSLFLTVEQFASRLIREVANGSFTQHFYQVMVHCTRFGSMYDGGPSKRLLFLCASLFSLCVLNYFYSMMNTDLVVIKDPLVFQSYDDVIKRKAIPLFIKGMSYNSLFNDPSVTGDRRKLWDYAVQSFGEERLYTQLSPILFLMMSLSVFKQKVVAVMDEALVPIVVTSGCSLAGRDVGRFPSVAKLIDQRERLGQLMRAVGIEQAEQDVVLAYAKLNDMHLYSPPEILVHISRDPEEQPYNQGLVYTAHNKKLMQLVQRGMTKVIETGLSVKQLKQMEEIDLFKNHQIAESLLGPALPSRRPEVEKCASKSPVKPTVELNAVTTDNFRTLFMLLGGIYCLLFLLLAVEILFKKFVDITGHHAEEQDELSRHQAEQQAPYRWRNGRPTPFYLAVVRRSLSYESRGHARTGWRV